jgi:hypothetical protein
MAQSLQERATRANARTAGAAAGIVIAVVAVQAILRAIIAVFGAIAYSTTGEGYLQNVFTPVGGLGIEFGTTVLPVAIGVFLAFWLLVPLTADLRVSGVALRSLAAAGIGAALSLVFTAVYSGSSLLFGAQSLVSALFGTVQSALYTFVGVTPVVLLAGFLAWLWVSKARPTASAV